MSINTIYGFLSDSGLSLQTPIDLTGSSDQGFGYLHGEALNYLIKKGMIRDTRSSRLPIVENEKLPGSMSIWFDQNRVNLDENEKSPEHLKGAERAYLELVELYNWDKIECVKDGKLRSIEDINEEILKLIEEMN